MNNQTNVGAASRRQTIEHAIQLAIQSRWEEAEQVNRQLLATFPEDVDANNRLGKALTELGRYAEARAAYTRAIELDSGNGIARKNLTRLAMLGDGGAAPASGEKVDPRLFVEETGKSGVTILMRPSGAALARMTAGDRVYLRRQDNSLIVENSRGDQLGTVDSRVALRLIKLMDGGNEYAAAIAGLSDHQCRIMIKETFQHPSQTGRLSFPPIPSDGFRAYTKESLIHYDLEDEDVHEEEHDGAEGWDSDSDTADGDVPLQRLRHNELASKDDEDEEE
ncbi:MAG TPA: tetratricopeptide repeat protein [Dehalococcoidia bacterium]|nr:tetratricopeptide repeat protein [Dehalococcoidia bacterium]